MKKQIYGHTYKTTCPRISISLISQVKKSILKLNYDYKCAIK